MELVAHQYVGVTDGIYQQAREKRSTTLQGEAAQQRIIALASRLLADVAAEAKAIGDEEEAIRKAQQRQEEPA